MYAKFSMVDRLVINLKIVASLQEGDKLIVDNQSNLSVDTRHWWTQSVTRYFMANSRWTTLTAIKQLITDVQSVSVEESLNKKNIIDLTLLKDAGQGMCNLKKTYSSDREITAALDRLCEQLYGMLDKASAFDSSPVITRPLFQPETQTQDTRDIDEEHHQRKKKGRHQD